MTPLSFEWKWAADYFVFMGLLYLAIIIIGCGLAYTYIKSWLECEHGTTPPKIETRTRYSKY
jgi:hypothetical protein